MLETDAVRIGIDSFETDGKGRRTSPTLLNRALISLLGEVACILYQFLSEVRQLAHRNDAMTKLLLTSSDTESGLPTCHSRNELIALSLLRRSA